MVLLKFINSCINLLNLRIKTKPISNRSYLRIQFLNQTNLPYGLSPEMLKEFNNVSFETPVFSYNGESCKIIFTNKVNENNKEKAFAKLVFINSSKAEQKFEMIPNEPIALAYGLEGKIPYLCVFTWIGGKM